MIDIKTTGIEKANRKYLDIAEKQLPFATALSLTNTAKQLQSSVKNQLKQDIDRPTPRTVNSVLIDPATKKRLWSAVYIRYEGVKGTSPTDYLTVLKGGGRSHKRSEGALRANGLLADFQYIVPASVRTDRFGNVTGRQMNRILSGLRSQRDQLQNSRTNKRGYFVMNETLRLGNRGRFGLKDGIYQRDNADVIKLFHIVNKKPQIKKVFDFRSYTEAKANRIFGPNLIAALRRAIATAK